MQVNIEAKESNTTRSPSKSTTKIGEDHVVYHDKVDDEGCQKVISRDTKKVHKAALLKINYSTRSKVGSPTNLNFKKVLVSYNMAFVLFLNHG